MLSSGTKGCEVKRNRMAGEMNKVEELETILQSPCWVIDLLPEQVPANAGGQYFAIEKYWRKEPQRAVLRQKQLHLILKLNCYLDVRVWDGPTNPAPETFAELIGQERLLLALGDALLVAEPDDTFLSKKEFFQLQFASFFRFMAAYLSLTHPVTRAKPLWCV